MKILHYIHGIPPIRTGGLIKYALDLIYGEKKSGNVREMLEMYERARDSFKCLD